MRPLSRIDMMEATRLTREGRLEEAMALLQGGRHSEPSRPTSTASETDAGPRQPGRPLLDMVPPSAASGGAWTAPPEADASLPKDEGDLPKGGLPMALRGLVSRTGGPGRGLGEALGARIGGGPGAAARPAVRLPDGARFEERIFTNEAGSRPYKLYVPSTFTGEALPLVVMLHGCTQSPDDFATGTRMNGLAEEFGFFVAYPGQTQAANMQRCWNWFNAADQQRGRGEPSLIAGITREVMRDVPVQEERVCIAGLSAGGAKAAVMAATYPDLYAAVGVHSGLACGAARDMASALAAMRQGGGAAGGLQAGRLASSKTSVPAIVFHGDRDTIVHPINGDEVAAQAGAGAAHRTEVTRGRSQDGRAFTRTVHRDETGRAMLEQWVLHGAGHAWSGGSTAGSYTDPLGPDASREMVRFFLGHQAMVLTGDEVRA
jgi:poly(hydroxyalkanoate) depolymerase family esterase